jgi:hypothetical protein
MWRPLGYNLRIAMFYMSFFQGSPVFRQRALLPHRRRGGDGRSAINPLRDEYEVLLF